MRWRLLSLVASFFVVAILAAEDLYQLLDIDRSASDRDIKRAYRTLSKRYHPDKNPGNEEAHHKFVAIADAYEVLSNADLRKVYDQQGHEGLERHRSGGGQRHHDPFDLFSQFFGGGGHFGGQRRGPDMEVRVKVPLKDFYTGNTREFSVEKQQICEACEGSGSADGAVDTCGACGGRGVQVQKFMLAPGIFQQVQSQCDKCGGKGTTIAHPCTVCGGTRVVRQSTSYSLDIEKGAERGAKVVFENEADASPDWVAGDLVIHLEEIDPSLDPANPDQTDGTFFRRKDHDLYWKEVLSLREAWFGDWTRNLTHLDGHLVRLGRPRGQTIQPNAVEIVAGEGMPLNDQEQERTGQTHGVLHVEYEVILPDQMESAMEQEFWSLWQKWRAKTGVHLDKEMGRNEKPLRDEL